MSQPKHTKGPFHVGTRGTDLMIMGPRGPKTTKVIAKVVSKHDAHLIASAPDMLAALEAIIADDKLMNALAGPRARMIMDAIAKARGES